MPTSDTAQPSTAAGAGAYIPLFLRYLYDTWVLGVSNAFAWRCSTRHKLLPFFQRNLSAKHIDIGVATGYYTAESRFPRNTQLTLVDLNPNSLDMARDRTRKTNPHIEVQTVHADVLSPTCLQQLPEGVDSISAFYLLHCVPGPAAKKGAAMARLGQLLTKDGVLYGTTVLGEGEESEGMAVHNWFGRLLLMQYNKTGVFGNEKDSVGDIMGPIRDKFESVEEERVGAVLIWKATGPRA